MALLSVSCLWDPRPLVASAASSWPSRCRLLPRGSSQPPGPPTPQRHSQRLASLPLHTSHPSSRAQDSFSTLTGATRKWKGVNTHGVSMWPMQARKQETRKTKLFSHPHSLPTMQQLQRVLSEDDVTRVSAHQVDTGWVVSPCICPASFLTPFPSLLFAQDGTPLSQLCVRGVAQGSACWETWAH